MGKNLDMIKGFIGITIAAPLAGAAVGTIGGISALGSGIRSATQVAIGGGLLSHSAKLFKWK